MARYSGRSRGEEPETYLDYLQGADYKKREGDLSLVRGAKGKSTDEKLSGLSDSLNSYNQARNSVDDVESDLRKHQRDIPNFKEIQTYLSKKLGSKTPSVQEILGYLRGEKKDINERIRKVEGKIDQLNLKKSHLERSAVGAGSNGGIKRYLSWLSVLFFIAALFFLSFGFTGAVIGSISSSQSWIGLVFVSVGAVLALIYFRNK